MKVIDLGLIDYASAYRKQKEVLEERKCGAIGDILIIAEHHPVFTLGRTGSRDNLLVDKEVLEKRNLELIEVDRGGDITFHGPGQVVLYPIIDLKERSADLHKYIRNLESIIIDFLAGFSIEGERVPGASGVWVKGKKIGFVGIGASHWITFHGFTVNINTSLSFFSMIASCGIKGIEITSLSRILGKSIDIEEAKSSLIDSFKKRFSVIDDTRKVSALA